MVTMEPGHSQFEHLLGVGDLLLEKSLEPVARDARVAMVCDGRFRQRISQRLQDLLPGRQWVCVFDDDPAKQAAGSVEGWPVLAIDAAGPGQADALIITSDRLEDQMIRRLGRLRESGTPVIRTARVDHNPLSLADLEAVLSDSRLDLFERPHPWREPLPAQPLWAGLEITSGCNINCVMCETHSARRQGGQMSLVQFAAGLDELDAIGSKGLTYHTIGEPTIHKQFDDVLRLSHERGFEVTLSTNGLLLHRHLEALARWPVAQVRFSVDGATRETYEKIRVGGKFDRLLENMRMMHELIAEHQLPTVMSMSVVLSRDNFHEALLFDESYGDWIEPDRVSYSLVNSLSAGADHYYQASKLIGDTAHQRMVPCEMLWHSLYVGHDGRVSACCRDYHGDLVVGDSKTHSLEEIWHGEALQSLRKRHVAAELSALPQSCQSCYRSETAAGELVAACVAVLGSESELTHNEKSECLNDFMDRLQLRLMEQAIETDATNTIQSEDLPLPVL